MKNIISIILLALLTINFSTAYAGKNPIRNHRRVKRVRVKKHARRPSATRRVIHRSVKRRIIRRVKR